MTEPVVLKSSDSAATLAFARGEADTLIVRVERPELSAAVPVYAVPGYGEPESLATFLDELARDWRGWEGERVWGSLEGEFALSCSADRLGHVYVTVRLSGQHGGEVWHADVQINTEAAQIEPVARALRRMFERATKGV